MQPPSLKKRNPTWHLPFAVKHQSKSATDCFEPGSLPVPQDNQMYHFPIAVCRDYGAGWKARSLEPP